MRSDEPVEQKSINNLESMIVRSSGVTVAGRVFGSGDINHLEPSVGSSATRLHYLPSCLYCKHIISRGKVLRAAQQSGVFLPV